MATAKEQQSSRVRWTAELEDILVDLWQDHECLYNVSSKNDHNHYDKDKSWGEIAAVLSIPVEEVKTRVTTLRTQYTKLLKSQPSGSGEKCLTSRQRWLLRNFERKFLKKHVAQRHSESSLDQSIKDLLSDKRDMNDHASDEDNMSEIATQGPHPTGRWSLSSHFQAWFKSLQRGGNSRASETEAIAADVGFHCIQARS